MACHQSITDAMNAAEVRSSSPETRERIRELQEADRGSRAELEQASTADGAPAAVARMISP
jgi:hypothetical protein